MEPTADFPLFKKVQSLSDESFEKFRTRQGSGLGRVGLGIMDEPAYDDGTLYMPLNSLTFGGTGSFGDSFSFVVQDGIVNESSPVILTVPGNSGLPVNANVVLARNFENFIRLGLRRGYIAMPQFCYRPELALEVYSSPEWVASEDWHGVVGFVLDDVSQEILKFLADRLDLEPLSYTKDEFDALQAAVLPKLEFEPELDF